jgi:hypothetical protein
VFNKDQVRKFRQALATAASHKEALDKLAELARVSPEFAESIRDLQTRREYLETVSKTCLAIAEPEPPAKS